MSKAILVIDIPNLESHEIDSYDMVADLKVRSLVLGGERYDFELKNVIIKPLPQKKEITEAMIWNTKYESTASYYGGFNACLGEILGEKE